MRRLSRWGPAVGLLLAVAWASCPAPGRAADGERVRFDTYDQVTLSGTFYAGPQGKKSACALLLHPVDATGQQEGWDSLAKKLQGKGLAVLMFDFRGHGESTGVGPDFWRDPVNRTLRGYRAGKPKDDIGPKDFTNAYQYATLVNDIAAAKRFLDQRNDNGECNSANVVVIGAESGATLGAMWIYSAWQTPRLQPQGLLVAPMRGQVEGQDISCAVWLSISPTVEKHRFPVDSWLRSPVREKIPMFLLYAEGEPKAAAFANHLYANVLRAERDKQLKFTILRAVKDAKLGGQELLKPSLDTEELILTYVTRVLGEKGTNPYSKRDSDRQIPVRVPIERFLR
jgi:hypothetical protein